MRKYLGETILDITQTKYKTYTVQDWVMLWIQKYGSIDGDHHKTWVIDQIARIVNGTKVIIKLAKWDDGQQEVRFTLDEPSIQYHKWVEKICDGEDGANTYSHDTGIAP
jgi:hypothetical protein